MPTKIHTDKAPSAIGSYSQAIKAGNTVYLSGQIPLDPVSMEIVNGDFESQVHQVFENLRHVATTAGGNMEDIVKLNVFLIDIAQTPIVNEVMKSFFDIFPARTTIQVSALPKNVPVEIDAIMVLSL